jgi:hypothetical protein
MRRKFFIMSYRSKRILEEGVMDFEAEIISALSELRKERREKKYLKE